VRYFLPFFKPRHTKTIEKKGQGEGWNRLHHRGGGGVFPGVFSCLGTCRGKWSLRADGGKSGPEEVRLTKKKQD